MVSCPAPHREPSALKRRERDLKAHEHAPTSHLPTVATRSNKELLALIEGAAKTRLLGWHLRDELELHAPARRVEAEYPIAKGTWVKRRYVAIKAGETTVLLPAGDPKEALRLFRLYERRLRATHPRLRGLARTVAFDLEPHPEDRDMGGCSVTAHGFVCFFDCLTENPSQYVFDHELAHHLSRKLRVSERGLAKHDVLPEWRRACRDDQGDEVQSFLWPAFRSRRGTRSLKELLLGGYHVTTYADEFPKPYNRYEEDFCDSLALYLASRRLKGLRGAGWASRLRFERVFRARARTLKALLA